MRFNKIKILILSFLVFNGSSLLAHPDSAESVINVNDISYRIILIGDAGEPAKDIDEPVLLALKQQASLIPDSTLVLFLGDNIYPDGLPPEDDSNRKEYERRIDEQIEAVVNAGASSVFIPGNHDWDQGSDEGWPQVNRESEYVLNKNLVNINFSPLKGCPGPEVVDFSTSIRVVFLDTQWWLQDESERPEPEDSICTFCTEEAIINALDSTLNISDGKFVIVAAHHPLSTHGPHGGYFSWKDHIFPLRNLNEYLWLPLPIIGSLYPLIRGMGVSNQDIMNSDYQDMKIQIENVIENYDNVLVASGHEHALQILRGKNDNLYVVSGAGYWGHVEESLTEGDDTIFAGRYEGFIILDFFKDERIRLSVRRVIDERGNSNEAFYHWINK